MRGSVRPARRLPVSTSLPSPTNQALYLKEKGGGQGAIGWEKGGNGLADRTGIRMTREPGTVHDSLSLGALFVF